MSKEAETELVLFAKFNNFKGFSEAAQKIKLWQYVAKLGEHNTCRVRRDNSTGKFKNTYTFKLTKVTSDNSQQRMEYNVAVDDDFLEGFKTLAFKLEDKIRYVFKVKDIPIQFMVNGKIINKVIDEVIYEIDLFLNNTGVITDWCKIDIELDSIKKKLNGKYDENVEKQILENIKTLPFEPTDIFLENDPDYKELREKVYSSQTILL